ncbi:MAG: DUF1800 family protein [Sediminibacterium sp.]|nr:DUF1800 family protein [Sediminibacterium sp.]
MDINTSWSLLLGYSDKQAKVIADKGMKHFLKKSFEAKYNQPTEFLNTTIQDIKLYRQQQKSLKDDPSGKKEFNKKYNQELQEFYTWWIINMQNSEFPLREKMTSFWQNHFVVTENKVKFNKWIYQHNQLIREHCFGNFKTLTKMMLFNNAMNLYLDNFDNKVDGLNENLARETLELFTLGIGNYTEMDIKNAAKGLAGMTAGDDGAVYRPKRMDNSPMNFLGKVGVFKAEEIVDIIFEQKAVPYLFTKKILTWFITDNPTDADVKKYGDYFRKKNFEITDLLLKIFTDEYNMPRPIGTKTKDPLTFLLPILTDLNLKVAYSRPLIYWLKGQGMLFYNQPNVKGWVGGEDWINTQSLTTRQSALHQILFMPNYAYKKLNLTNIDGSSGKLEINLLPNDTNKTIIDRMVNKWSFIDSEEMQTDLETVLRYDFNPQAPNAENGVIRFYDYLISRPETQIL